MAEEVAYLAAILVDGRDQDMRGRFACKLDNQFGKVGLDSANASFRQRLVEVNFVGSEGLDLHHLVRTGFLDKLCDDAIGLSSITRPVDLSSSMLDCCFELQQVFIEVAHGTRFD